VNLKKWQSLSPKTREILQQVAIRHETESLEALQKLWKEEEAELKKRGVKTIAQSPEASKRFYEGARAASLARMKERMEKSGGMENSRRSSTSSRQDRCPNKEARLQGVRRPAVRHGVDGRLPHRAMMVIITLDVVVRNLGYQSSSHFFTFTEYALLIVPCLGAPWLVREKGHIYVEILLMHLKPRARRWLMRFIGSPASPCAWSSPGMASA